MCVKGEEYAAGRGSAVVAVQCARAGRCVCVQRAVRAVKAQVCVAVVEERREKKCHTDRKKRRRTTQYPSLNHK